MNFLASVVQLADATGVSVRLGCGEILRVPTPLPGPVSGDAVTVGVRPEDLCVVQAGPLHAIVHLWNGSVRTACHMADWRTIRSSSCRRPVTASLQRISWCRSRRPDGCTCSMPPDGHVVPPLVI